MSTPRTRALGRSGIEVSALGLGCWAIGGPWTFNGAPGGWSRVDDDESVRAIHRALDLGVTFFDTAANYGAGHSERVLGRALQGRPDVVVATKFGYAVDETGKTVLPYDGTEDDSDVAARLRSDVEASLARLRTDRLDVYLLHVGGLRVERALDAREVLDDLVAEGKIRTYGWSTDRVDAVRAFAAGAPGCGVVEHELSVLNDSSDMLALCDEHELAAIIRAPLGMGLLTGKFAPDSTFAPDDVRHVAQWHPGFRDGRPTRLWLDQLDAIRDVLTSQGRTPAQGALAWVWARSARTVPVPGFRTVEQVEDDCGALALGPLTAQQMSEIDLILGRSADRDPVPSS